MFNNIIHTIDNCFYMLGFIRKSSKSRIIISLLMPIMLSVNELMISVVLLRYIINSMQNGVPFHEILIYSSILMLIVFVGFLLFDVYSNIYLPKSNIKISQKFNEMLLEKVSKVDLEKYDDPVFYDKLLRASNELESRAISVLDTLARTISSVLVVVGLTSAFIAIEPVLVLFAILPIVFSLPLSIIRNKVNYKFNMESLLPSRVIAYVKRVFFQVDYAKEIRFSNISKVMKKQMNDSFANNNQLINKFAVKRTLLSLGETTNQIVFVFYATYVYLVYSIVVLKQLTLGDFSAMFSAVRNVEGSLRTLMQLIPALQEQSMYIDNLREFLELEPKIKDSSDAERIQSEHKSHSFTIKDVSFVYPNSNTHACKNISFEIKQGQKVAFVGENGAGKTTLIKLLLRLYDPASGEICLNNKNIMNYKLSDYRSLFSTVFQDFNVFSASLAENVEMDVVDTDERRKKVLDSLAFAGFSNDNLSVNGDLNKSLDRIITKEFDENGVVLSIGQQQKLAIARAYAKSGDVIVMDEPTSALDPVSEYEFNKQLLSLGANKTIIIISHRLTTTKSADKIFYMEHGEITESGTHDELMLLDGKYAYMFKLQSKQYVG